MRTPPRHQRSCDDHPKWTAGCEPCNVQNRRYMIRRKLLVAQGQRLSTGAQVTTERIRQLRAAGHSTTAIGIAANIHRNYVIELSRGQREWVQLKTFHAIEKVYRELRDYPGGDKRAAGYARKRGWEPPAPPPMPTQVGEDVVDEVAVERAVAGDRVTLTRAESMEAWRRLEKSGDLSLREIARRLHTSEKTIGRWRTGEIRRPSTTRARTKRSA